MKVKETTSTYLTRKRPFTYQDYLKLPEDDFRYQVINGGLVMTPSPITAHQRVCERIGYELSKYVERTKTGEVLRAPMDVVLSKENVYQPDILFISNDNSQIARENNIDGAPDLVIEVLSPATSTYDLISKKENYQKYGVEEYWIVDPKQEWIEVYCNDHGEFKLESRLEKEGTVKSRLLKGFQVDMVHVFRR
ncbi:MAG: Uma2 family endonuclease [bacterium]